MDARTGSLDAGARERRGRRGALGLVLAAALPTACGGGPTVDGAPPAATVDTSPGVRHPTAERVVLPNGMTVVIEEVRSRPVVALSLNALGGSRDETPEEEGGAHFLEHMFYMGTETRRLGQLRDEIMDRGGSCNGLTDYDRTEYWALVRSEDFDLALDGLADGARNVLVKPEDVERERSIILDEIRQRIDDPQMFAREEAAALAFHPHPYARRRDGTADSIKRMGREDLAGIYRRHFRPDRLVLVITGDVDRERALAAVKAKFGTMEAVGAPPPRGANPAPGRGFEERFVSRDLAQAYVVLAAPAPGMAHPDAPAMDLATEFLRARLYTDLVLVKRIASSVTGSCVNSHDLGFLEFTCTPVRPELAPAVEQAALAQIAETAKIPTGRTDWDEQAELARFQRTMRLSLAFDREEAAARRSWLVFGAVMGTLEHLATYEERLDAVTLADIGRVMRTYAGADGLNVVVCGPEAARATAEDLAKRAPLLEALRYPETPDFGAVADPAGARGAWQESQLPNGLRVLVGTDPSFDLVSLALYTSGGSEADPPGREGRANLCNTMLSIGAAEGTRADGTRDDAWSRQRFSQVLNRLGLKFWKGSSRTYSHHLLSVARADLETAIDLLRAAYLRPTFPEAEIAIETGQTLGSLRADEDQIGSVAFAHARRLLYGASHLYARPDRGTLASVPRLTRDDCLECYRETFRPDRAVLVLYGNLTAREGRELARVGFGDWRPQPPPGGTQAPAPAPLTPAPPGPPTPGEHVFPMDKAQAYVILCAPAVAREHPDFAAADFALRISSLRAFRELIYEKKVGYSAGGTLEAGRTGGGFFLFAQCAPEKIEVAKTELRGLAQRIVSRPIPPEEFEKMRRSILGERPIQMQRGVNRAAEAGAYVAYGLPPDHWQAEQGELMALTPAAVQAAVAKWLDPDKMTVVVVRRAP